MIKSKKPVISICAVRTGAGKSQTTRRISEILKEKGYRHAVIRHPMPYGDLAKQAVQIFRTVSDLDKYRCTVEEREDYEPHLAVGSTVFAGVDYEKILRAAEKEADIILWDGGNNDFSFVKPDLNIVVADPFRVGHELTYHPGETNLRMADAVIINKVNTASKKNVAELEKNIRLANPGATVIKAASMIKVEKPTAIKNRRVCVVEDGPTLTHGEMKFGAGFIAAKKYGAKPVDPRKYAVGSIARAYKKYPHLGAILPALGYGPKQMKELETSINRMPCEAVVIGTPVDLRKFLKIKKPSVRVYYDLEERSGPKLENLVAGMLKRKLH